MASSFLNSSDSSDDEDLCLQKSYFSRSPRKSFTQTQSPSLKAQNEMDDILISMGVNIGEKRKAAGSAAAPSGSRRVGMRERSQTAPEADGKKGPNSFFDSLLKEAQEKIENQEEAKKHEQVLANFEIDQDFLHKPIVEPKAEEPTEEGGLGFESKDDEDGDNDVVVDGIITVFDLEAALPPEPALRNLKDDLIYSTIFEALICAEEEERELLGILHSYVIPRWLQKKNLPLPQEISTFLIDIVAFHQNQLVAYGALKTLKACLSPEYQTKDARPLLHLQTVERVFGEYHALFLGPNKYSQLGSQKMAEDEGHLILRQNLCNFFKFMSLCFEEKSYKLSEKDFTKLLIWLSYTQLDSHIQRSCAFEARLCLEKALDQCPKDTWRTVVTEACSCILNRGIEELISDSDVRMEDVLVLIGRNFPLTQRGLDFLKCYTHMALIQLLPDSDYSNKRHADYQKMNYENAHLILSTIEDSEYQIHQKEHSNNAEKKLYCTVALMDLMVVTVFLEFEPDEKRDYVERVTQLHNKIKNALSSTVQNIKELLGLIRSKYQPIMKEMDDREELSQSQTSPITSPFRY